MNPFKKVVDIAAKVIRFILSPAGRDRVAKALEQVQEFLESGWAMQAVKVIAELTPTRADNEMLALVQRYGLGFVTPDMLRNETFVNGLLKKAAIYELQRISGLKVSNTVLDLAVQAAYIAYQENKK